MIAETETPPLYFGENLTDAECEAMMLVRFGVGARVFKKHFKKELNLMSRKWHDYQILHPVVATYLYAFEYTKAYRRYYSSVIDHEKGQYVKGFKGKDAWGSTNSGGFITGRQHADEMGIPYDFYITNAIDFLYIKKWKHLPRPCHLYAEDVRETVAARWLEYSSSTLILAKDPFFKDVANIEAPEFQAHQARIRQYIDRSRARAMTVDSIREMGYITPL